MAASRPYSPANPQLGAQAVTKCTLSPKTTTNKCRQVSIQVKPDIARGTSPEKCLSLPSVAGVVCGAADTGRGVEREIAGRLERLRAIIRRKRG
jgi:hypothetical protein